MSSSGDFHEVLEAIRAYYPPEDPSDPKVRKRRQIVEAAKALFVRHGYRKASVDDVAREAGVAKGTVYLYFERKVDLLVQAILDEKRQFIADLEPILTSDLPPRERLRSYLRLAMFAASQMPLVSRLVTGDRELFLAFRELDQQTSQRIDAIRFDFVAQLLSAASPGWSEAVLSDRTRALTALLFTAPFAEETFRGGLSTRRYAEVIADILVEGVLAIPESQ